MTTLDEIFGLQGTRAVVTGASSGLGVTFARALVGAGAEVALVARRAERLAEVAAELAAGGGRVATIPADVTEPDAPGRIFDRVEQVLGPADILVNNAGASEASRAEKLERAAWNRVLDLDLSAPFHLAQEFARRAFDRGAPGRIVNVSSVLGSHASSLPGLASYVAAKGGLSNLTRQLATEWAGRGVLVNALCPGYFETELNSRAFASPAIRERIESFTPMGRTGRPEELAPALLLLVSPASTYLTGATLHVDGGYTAW